MNNRIKGNMIEDDFESMISDRGLLYTRCNNEFDFNVLDKDGDSVYIDVKSSEISHPFSDNRTKAQTYKIGRFVITKAQQKYGCYMACYVTFHDRFMFMGIIHSIAFGKSRYLSLHKLRQAEMLQFDDFIKKVLKL